MSLVWKDRFKFQLEGESQERQTPKADDFQYHHSILKKTDIAKRSFKVDILFISKGTY